jgi:hypothetical protein
MAIEEARFVGRLEGYMDSQSSIQMSILTIQQADTLHSSTSGALTHLLSAQTFPERGRAPPFNSVDKTRRCVT